MTSSSSYLVKAIGSVAASLVIGVSLAASGFWTHGETPEQETHAETSEQETDEVTAHAPVQPAPDDPDAFAWLHPAAAPADWHSSVLPSGDARMAYPPGWKPIQTDPGTVTSALRDSDGEIHGYLNATPQQSSETPANWAGFRPDHNADEGIVDLRPIAAARNLSFRSGRGSCLLEDYRTSTDHLYREIACIVSGARATTVIVGAAPPDEWQRQGRAIERAISSFLT